MKYIQPLFLEKRLQEEFEEFGYVVTPLITSEQADELVELFHETRALHQTVSALHHTTTDTQNPDLIRRVDSKIKQLFVPALDLILQNFKPLVGCIHIKEKGEGSATGIHQDPTFVDEDNFVSANVWVALHDMNEYNGNLFFIPGSNKIECLRVTPDSPSYYEYFNSSLPEMAVQVPLKKGDAVIFNNATIHGATDNVRDDLRLAATLLICSKSAEWFIFYKEKITAFDKIEKYQLDFDAFITMAKDGRPNASTFKGFISYNFPSISKEAFLQATGRIKPALSYFHRIKAVFKRKMAV
jgi:ectoine hydroxylase-related dioxygenase (phytanoyl-CoA dioxygenase family)